MRGILSFSLIKVCSSGHFGRDWTHPLDCPYWDAFVGWYSAMRNFVSKWILIVSFVHFVQIAQK